LPDLNKLKNRQAQILDHKKYHKSAVILPLINYQRQDCLLFEIRSPNLKSQPGEICFPGGGIEATDNTAENAAIRETCEELGLEKTDIEIIGPLDILVTPFQALIYPFTARLKDYKKISPNEAEVEDIFYVPLQHFLENKPQTYYTQVSIKAQTNFPFHLLPNGKTYNWRKGVYPINFYIYQDKIIWGITARIIKNFIDLVK